MCALCGTAKVSDTKANLFGSTHLQTTTHRYLRCQPGEDVRFRRVCGWFCRESLLAARKRRLLVKRERESTRETGMAWRACTCKFRGPIAVLACVLGSVVQDHRDNAATVWPAHA